MENIDSPSKNELMLEVPQIGTSKKIEIVQWYVKEGDQVSKEQVLCELLTEKASFQMEAPVNGKVKSILKKTHSPVKIGEKIICILVE